MATQRYVSTSFWDDPWITGLKPEEKYLYLYFLTNPLTNIAGVYQISLKRMCFDTDLEPKRIQEIIAVFARARKAYFYSDEYIVLPKWPRHQKWQEHKKIELGIVAILKELPPDLLGFLVQIGYTYPIDSLSIPYTYPSNYSDTDTDTDTDTDIDLDTDLELAKVSSFGGEDVPKLDGEVAEFIEGEKREACRVPHKEIISFLNETCHTKYSHESDYIRRLLKARWNDGYRLPDFQAVIRVKAKQWLNDSKMVKYLRPVTLFSASKFDSYLQESAHLKQAKKDICPQCGGQNGRHAESCPVLQRANNKKARDGPEDLPAF